MSHRHSEPGAHIPLTMEMLQIRSSIVGAIPCSRPVALHLHRLPSSPPPPLFVEFASVEPTVRHAHPCIAPATCPSADFTSPGAALRKILYSLRLKLRNVITLYSTNPPAPSTSRTTHHPTAKFYRTPPLVDLTDDVTTHHPTEYV